ncbi:MAG: acetyl-CoA carboxylase biotin carboxyl carrier protein subunit [Firmicutes bacterium]|nr:acetyl-CoA carboxylase biotin carboxyl carrier protein subunit [Bacillota bacterium]
MVRRSFKVSVDGEIFNVEVEEVKSGGSVSRDVARKGHEEPEQAKPTSMKTKKMPVNVSGGGKSVKAPMPGTIVGVKVTEGDEVGENEVLVILEAMKMENEITSPVSGTVKKILVNKGDTVDSDEVLMIIG